MIFSVTQNGIVLDPSKYNWDEENKVFSTEEDNLVLDFSNINGIVFYTGSSCRFYTGSYYRFDTGSYCRFDTGSNCRFDTGCDCKFDTGSSCRFYTGDNCTFATGFDCTFDTGSCTFVTGNKSVIRTSYNSKIKMKENCIVYRSDTDEVWMFSNCMIQTHEENEPGYLDEAELICKDIIE